MLTEEFLDLTLKELERLTGVKESAWSRFFSGENIHEITLKKAAPALGMSTARLLDAINIKRRIKLERTHNLCNN